MDLVSAMFWPECRPFSIALAIMIGIALLEGAGALIGASVSGMLSGLLDSDADIPNSDIAGDNPGGVLSKALGWLRVGKLPRPDRADCRTNHVRHSRDHSPGLDERGDRHTTECMGGSHHSGSRNAARHPMEQRMDRQPDARRRHASGVYKDVPGAKRGGHARTGTDERPWTMQD